MDNINEYLVNKLRGRDEVSVSSLKVEINNFIHMYGDESLTLGQAEKISIKILNLLRPDWQEENIPGN